MFSEQEILQEKLKHRLEKKEFKDFQSFCETNYGKKVENEIKILYSKIKTEND